jgi:ribosomal protein S12 methylthiotransferase accessory factor YcaO
MLNLAAIKYRRALAESGGPIARIVSSPVSIFGRSIYQADAFLTPGLSPRKPAFEKCDEADGTGSSDSPQTARNMAVSEAIERWAFHSEFAGPNARRYGFDQDSSANGMAAFPGIFKTQARGRAHLEALELLSLVAWWNGHIDASPACSALPGIDILRLHHPADFGEVVIVYRKSKSGHVSYGYAAGNSMAGATTRAVIELARNEFIITCHKICGRTKPINNYLERRCLYFASPDGHQEFLARVEAGPTKAAPSWESLYDGEIAGPWSRYATVWRTALRMPTQDFLDPRLNFFYW